MKRLVLIIGFLVSFVALPCRAESPTPKRIVTLAPSLGELVADFLGSDLSNLVGVSEYTDYPQALLHTTSIGPYYRINLEKVLSLKPDLILATQDGNSKEQIEHLKELKLNVLVVNTGNFNDIKNSMILVGQAMGRPLQGEKMAQDFQKGLDQILAKNVKRKNVRVLLELDENPLVVVGGRTFLSEALSTIGACNIYADEKIQHYPKPSVEDVLNRNPDYILILALGKGADDLKPFKIMADHWARLSSLKAVKDHHVLVVQSDGLMRPTSRLLEGLSQLEKIIYAGP